MTTSQNAPLNSSRSVAFPLLVAALLLSGLPAFAGQQQQPASKSAAPASTQESFPSAKAATDALIHASDPYDLTALLKILGPDAESLVSSADQVQDKNIAADFAEKAKRHTEIHVDPKNPSRATVLVGDDDWPLPIPIVKRGSSWTFDTKAGRTEMLYRRIGANELDAIQVCRGYVEAQKEYALTLHDGSVVNQYAQRVISTPGKQDGLVWKNPDGTLGGPIAENIADAIQQGYSEKAKPYHGYYFKILKAQGPAAPLGAMNFVIEGAMIGGFALAAAPAEYRVTGVKSFIVGFNGIVYQKDLGPDTLKLFQQMELFNPDKSWTPTDDSWPSDTPEAHDAIVNPSN